ncbi:MAG: hypothetical protein LBS31_13285 [Candidatus Adiutrix sp.]|jgi:hypothetical protein|nr:hypothetical protein [Candidatus Adiutrix sp.]
MQGYVEEGDYYYVKVASGAEMFINLSLSGVLGVNLTTAVFVLALTLGVSVSASPGRKFEAGLHEFEFSGFKTRSGLIRLKAALSAVKTGINTIKTTVETQRATLDDTVVSASQLETIGAVEEAALSLSQAGAEALAVAGQRQEAALAASAVNGAETRAEGAAASLDASQTEAFGQAQQAAGQSTRIRGADLGAFGTAAVNSVVRTQSGALIIM